VLGLVFAIYDRIGEGWTLCLLSSDVLSQTKCLTDAFPY
jgi:hypothetical protein